MKLSGKTALITGGSSGIGLETARLFIEEGSTVVILGRDQKRLASAVESLGTSAYGIAVDVAQPDALAAAIQQASRRLGGIDILFANAGVSETPPIAATTEAAFDAFMGVNVKGTVFTVVNALPLLRDGASIVLTGSVAARRGWPADPLYSASKGAIRSFGRALAMDADILSRLIRVNVVTPGATETNLAKAATEDPQVRQYVADQVPMKRWGKAREVAEAVLFLGSDAASYVTGSEITVDGGLAHV